MATVSERWMRVVLSGARADVVMTVTSDYCFLRPDGDGEVRARDLKLGTILLVGAGYFEVRELELLVELADSVRAYFRANPAQRLRARVGRSRADWSPAAQEGRSPVWPASRAPRVLPSRSRRVAAPPRGPPRARAAPRSVFIFLP